MGSQTPRRQSRKKRCDRTAAQATAPFDPLTDYWWAEWRDHPLLRTKLNKALCARWLDLIEAGLVRNRDRGRTPASWAELYAALTRDRTSLNRWINGQSRASAIDIVALATLIEVPSSEFLPDHAQWIECATLLLCDGEASREEARAYALYRLAYPQSKPSGLDPAAVESVVEKMPGWNADQVTAAVMKVAECLRRALAHPPGKKRK